MPRGDRTGPLGSGARSGRCAGFCAGFDMPGFANFTTAGGNGRPMAPRRGGWVCRPFGGRGHRNRYYAKDVQGRFPFAGMAADPAISPELEKESLRLRATALQSELESINKRLSEMEQE